MKTTRKSSQQPDNLIFSQVHISRALTIVDILINKAFHYAASENGGQSVITGFMKFKLNSPPFDSGFSSLFQHYTPNRTGREFMRAKGYNSKIKHLHSGLCFAEVY